MSTAIFISPERAVEVGTRIVKSAFINPSSWTYVIKPFLKRGEMKGYSLTVKNGSDSYLITDEHVAIHT